LENLGTFKDTEFKVLKPQQKQESSSGGDSESSDENQPAQQSDDEMEEIPLKTKEEILADLEKAGLKDNSRNEETSEQYNIGDKSPEKKEGEGEDKKESEQPIKEKSERQKKIDEKNTKDKEQRDLVRTKNIITEKINQYNTIIIKHGDNRPAKVKSTLETAITELEELRNSAKTN
jgi:hypothetical protein